LAIRICSLFTKSISLSLSSGAPIAYAIIICVPSFEGSPNSLAIKHQTDVSSLSGQVMFQPVSILLPNGLRFFSPLSAAFLSVSLTVYLPLPSKGEIRGYHVPHKYHEWVRSRLDADGSMSATEDSRASVPGHLPFGSSLSAPLACFPLRRLQRFAYANHTTQP
jgi:hypothetical protein